MKTSGEMDRKVEIIYFLIIPRQIYDRWGNMQKQGDYNETEISYATVNNNKILISSVYLAQNEICLFRKNIFCVLFIDSDVTLIYPGSKC